MILSVIIPVYNSERYLPECLDSLRNQTFQDLEFICVDDGSTDNSGAICEQYAAMDKRFSVIHQANGGAAAARNRGLDLAQGKFIAFMDSDDFLEPDAYERTIAKFTSDEIDIVQFLFRMFDDHGSIQCGFPTIKQINTTFQDRLNCILSTKHISCNKIYRRSFLLHNKIRYPEGYWYEDVPFTHQCAFLARRIDAYSDLLYHYRIGHGISTNKDSSSKAIEYIRTYELMYHLMLQYNLDKDQKEFYERERLSVFRSVYRRHTLPSQRPLAKQMILDRLTENDWAWLADGSRQFPARKRAFFYWLAGQPAEAVKVFLFTFWKGV